MSADQLAPLDALADRWDAFTPTPAGFYPEASAYVDGQESGHSMCADDLRAAIAEARALAPEQSTDPNGATNDDSWSDEDPLCVCGRSDRGRDGHEFGPGCDSWEPDLYDPTPDPIRDLLAEVAEGHYFQEEFGGCSCGQEEGINYASWAWAAHLAAEQAVVIRRATEEDS